MRRVAAVATAKQWREIDYALSHVREARATRALALSRDHGFFGRKDVLISHKDVLVLAHAMEQTERAIAQLARLSGDEYPPEWLTPRIERSKRSDGWRHGTSDARSGADDRRDPG